MKTDPYERGEILGYEASFGTDRQGRRNVHVARAFGRRVRVGHEFDRLGREPFDELSEEAVEGDARKDGVARLFEAGDALLTEVVFTQLRRLPIALFAAPCIDEVDLLDAERGRRGDDAVQDFRAREGEDECERDGRRRIAIERDAHF